MVVGAIVLRSTGDGITVLSLLLIVLLMVEGISKVVFALTIRPFPEWYWVLASGALGIVLACILWASLPVGGPWILAVLLGLQLIGEGAALGYLAWRARQS